MTKVLHYFSTMEQKLGFHGQEMADYLNKKSGLLGISGVSSDMRDVDVYKRQALKSAGVP